MRSVLWISGLVGVAALAFLLCAEAVSPGAPSTNERSPTATPQVRDETTATNPTRRERVPAPDPVVGAAGTQAVRVVATLPTGEPAAAATVRYHAVPAVPSRAAEADEAKDLEVELASGGQEAVTDERGNVAIAVAADTTLCVRRGEYYGEARTDGNAAEVRVALQRDVPLRVQVLDTDGRPREVAMRRPAEHVAASPGATPDSGCARPSAPGAKSLRRLRRKDDLCLRADDPARVGSACFDRSQKRSLVMRLLAAFAVLSLMSFVPAQTPADAAGKTPANAAAAEKFKALSAENMARMRKAGRDQEAQAEVRKARTSDLEAFAKEFPKTAEATKAHLELAGMAAMSKDMEAGKRSLLAIEVAHLDLGSSLRAAISANALELADAKKQFLDSAHTKAKTIDERFEIASALRGPMKDTEAADKLVADIEASAKSPEDKAAVMMAKAVAARRADSKNKEAWANNLGEIARLHPDTKAGKLAASKLAAAKLAPGSDPVAFKTKDMDGKDVAPADYKGKVLLIDFWATWCGPCMQELPNVLKTYAEYHDKGFEILGISLDREDGREKLVSTIKEQGMSWRHVYDGKWWQAEVAQLHDITSIPATILIGKDGKVAGMNLRGEKLAEAVAKALEAK